MRIIKYSPRDPSILFWTVTVLSSKEHDDWLVVGHVVELDAGNWPAMLVGVRQY